MWVEDVESVVGWANELTLGPNKRLLLGYLQTTAELITLSEELHADGFVITRILQAWFS